MKAEQHLPWVDTIRFIAIFLVICCHCCDPFNLSGQSSNNDVFSFWGAFYGSALRVCVPLFAMMTGLLLLPIKQQSTIEFYKKRVLRVAVPLLIWGVIYNLFPWIVGVFGGGKEIVATFFPYSAAYGATPSLTFADAMYNVALVPFHFSVYATHTWYIYMLIGLYLFMPILSAWLERCSRSDLHVMLTLWGVTLFLPYVKEYLLTDFWGSCSWNAFGMLYYFAGFNGYFLLGYYLRRYEIGTKTPLPKLIAVLAPLFALGFIVTYLGFRKITADPTSTESMIELFWTYCSINVAIMTFAAFILLRRIKTSSYIASVFEHSSRYGLGIYLCHYFFVGVGYLLVDVLNFPIPCRIPFAAIVVMLLSWTLTATIFKIAPKTAKWVMG